MKKGKFLKYIILTIVCFMSFFVFSSEVVYASETTKGVNISGTDIYLKVEQVQGEDAYSIVGTYCGENNDNCYMNVSDITLTIPAYFESSPIVSIANGSGGAGVLDVIKAFVNEISFEGTNLKTIGTYAFYGFDNVSKVVVPKSVEYVGNYAFSMSSLNEITFNRFEVNEEKIITELESESVFGFITNTLRVVLASEGVRDDYFNVWDIANWSEDAQELIILTYKINYEFCNGSDCEPYTYYAGEKLGEVREISRTGFVYDWVSEEGGEITVESIAQKPRDKEIHTVNAVWKLADPKNIVISSDAQDNKKVYAGKNSKVTVSASVEHVLDVDVSYEWSRRKDGINYYNISNTNSYSFYEVKESGTYICEVIISYMDENSVSYVSEPYTVSLEVEILKKDLTISVIKDFEVVYGTYFKLEETSDYDEYVTINGLVDGETVKTIKIDEYNEGNKNVAAKKYEKVLKAIPGVIGYEDESYSKDYSENYNLVYTEENLGDLTVLAKEKEVVLDNDKVVTYGEEVELTDFVGIDEVYGGAFRNSLTVTYSKAPGDDVDDYEIVGAVLNDSNYKIKFICNAVVKVIPKSVSVNWNEEVLNPWVYDGNVTEISAFYKNLDEQNIEVSISLVKLIKSSTGEIIGEEAVNELKNAGSYKATASMINDPLNANANYVLDSSKVLNIEIEQAESDFIGADKQFKVYNGNPQTVDVRLNHNEGGDITYSDYNTCVDAHTDDLSNCAITVRTTGTENYAPKEKTFYLHILPVEKVIEPETFYKTYGSAIGLYGLHSKIDGVNGDKVDVYFKLENITDVTEILNVGTYEIEDIYLVDDSNYSFTMKDNSGEGKLVVNPAPLQLIFHFYEGLVYDGTNHVIEVEIVGNLEKDDVGLILDRGDKPVFKNAGDYRIDATVTNENYYIESGSYLEFSIAKANYDVSKIVINDKEAKFNFKYHFVNIEGTLPDGLRVEYSIDGRKGNGTFAPFTHDIKVSFIGDFENYNYIEPLTATLYINFTWVWVTLGVTFGVIALLAGVLFFLIKTGKLRIRKRVKRKKLYQIIKKNRQLNDINEIIRKHKNKLEKENVENDVIIEDPVKFVKNPVELTEDEMLSASFVDKLFESEYGTKQLYSEVKNELLSYEGVVSKIKRDYETFYLNNIPVARFDVEKGDLCVGFALDPSQYRKDEYHHVNASKDKKFSPVPLKLKVNSIESLRHAKMFVRIIRKREKIKSVSNFIRVDYAAVYSEKDDSFRLFKKVFSKKNKEED